MISNTNSFTVMFVLNSTVMGGGNISLINLMNELHNKGVKMHVVHPDDEIDKTFKERTSSIVIDYHKVKLYPQIYYKCTNVNDTIRKHLKKVLCINKIRLKREIRDLRKIVESIKPDIIHTNTGVIHSGYYVARECNIPHLWHLREYQTKDFGYEIYPSKEAFVSLLKQSYVVTITKDILDYFSLSKCEDSVCIYNGCFSEKDTSSILPKNKYFLCCSRISEEKGHDEIIKAFSLFYSTNKDYRLVIAGFGEKDYIDYLHALSEKLGCEKAIEYVGFLKDIRPYMDNAQALIVASRFEGFGRMTAEAAFRGCIVIGRNTGGTKEILQEIGGYSYNNGFEELAKKMVEVSELDQIQYRERIEKAQKRAIELYSNEKSASYIYDLYLKMMNNLKN